MCLETRFPVKSWVRGGGRKRARRSPFLWSTAEESRKSLSVDLHPPLVPPPPPPSRSSVEEPTHWPENSSLSCGTSPAVSRRRSSGSTRGQGRSSMLSFARSPIQYVDFKGSKFRFVKEELCFDLYRRKGSCNFVKWKRWKNLEYCGSTSDIHDGINSAPGVSREDFGYFYVWRLFGDNEIKRIGKVSGICY